RASRRAKASPRPLVVRPLTTRRANRTLVGRPGSPRIPRKGSIPRMAVTSPDDLVSAVARDRRMAGYRVRRQGDGWIELEAAAQRAGMPVLLVVAWAEVWKDAAQLRPHLVRARSGNYGLILVGTDPEFEAAKLDAMPADVDVSAAVAPLGMARL